jgi:hypothetical protein
MNCLVAEIFIRAAIKKLFDWKSPTSIWAISEGHDNYAIEETYTRDRDKYVIRISVQRIGCKR